MRNRLRRLAESLLAGPRAFAEARIGRFQDRTDHRASLRAIAPLSRSLDVIKESWPETVTSADDEPIFVMAALWRSGSTLLQRMIAAGGEALIWGEPYQHCQYVQLLARSLSVIGTSSVYNFVHARDWHIAHDPTAARQRIDAVPDRFEANLFPHPAALAEAHRAFFRQLYAAPAAQMGFGRWGLKEVRLTIDHALYLKWLFPRSRFVLSFRNPYDSYRSYHPFRNWYYGWPDQPVTTATRFGRLWQEVVGGFVRGGESVGALVIRFEDLVEGDVPAQRMSEHLGCRVDTSVLNKRIRHRTEPSAPRTERVPADELRLLEQAVEPLASQLGYHAPR